MKGNGSAKKVTGNGLTLEQKITRALKQKRYRKNVKVGRAQIGLECDKAFKDALIRASKGEDDGAMERLLSDPKMNQFLRAMLELEMVLIT